MNHKKVKKGDIVFSQKVAYFECHTLDADVTDEYGPYGQRQTGEVGFFRTLGLIPSRLVYDSLEVFAKGADGECIAVYDIENEKWIQSTEGTPMPVLQ